MAEFSEKIVSVVYANEAHDMIKVRYEDGDRLGVYHLPNDENNADFQDLVSEGWDFEKILDETAEAKKAESSAFNIQVNAAAKELAMEMIGTDVLLKEKERLEQETGKLAASLEEVTVNYSDAKRKVGNSNDAIVYDHMLEFNDNSETLFKIKLWALETDIVKNADKATKSSIRKAKRITQLIGIIDSLME